MGFAGAELEELLQLGEVLVEGDIEFLLEKTNANANSIHGNSHTPFVSISQSSILEICPQSAQNS